MVKCVYDANVEQENNEKCDKLYSYYNYNGQLFYHINVVEDLN